MKKLKGGIQMNETNECNEVEDAEAETEETEADTFGDGGEIDWIGKSFIW